MYKTLRTIQSWLVRKTKPYFTKKRFLTKSPMMKQMFVTGNKKVFMSVSKRLISFKRNKNIKIIKRKRLNNKKFSKPILVTKNYKFLLRKKSPKIKLVKLITGLKNKNITFKNYSKNKRKRDNKKRFYRESGK